MKCLWIHADLYFELKKEIDPISIPVDQLFYGTREELVDVARDESLEEWVCFKGPVL
jgi:hypothetical protein